MLMYYSIGMWTYVFGKLSRVAVKQTNFNWETFSVSNIIETFQNYFTRELLPYNFSSEVTLQFNVSYMEL